MTYQASDEDTPATSENEQTTNQSPCSIFLYHCLCHSLTVYGDYTQKQRQKWEVVYLAPSFMADLYRWWWVFVGELLGATCSVRSSEAESLQWLLIAL